MVHGAGELAAARRASRQAGASHLGLFDARTTRIEDGRRRSRTRIAPYRELLMARDVMVGPQCGLELIPRDAAFDKLLQSRYLRETAAEGVAMALLTSTIGSFPKPQALHEARRRFAEGEIDAAALRQVEDEAIRGVLGLQDELGIDLLVDGEMDRADPITTFAERLSGVEIDGWVRVYGDRYVRQAEDHRAAWRAPRPRRSTAGGSRATPRGAPSRRFCPDRTR